MDYAQDRKKIPDGEQALKILRPRQVMDILGVSRTTLWRWSRERMDFPKPIKIGPNTSGWLASEIRRFVGEVL